MVKLHFDINIFVLSSLNELYFLNTNTIEPYNVREVRLHVRHINDLIHSIDPIDNFNAVNCNSLTYVNDLTNGDITGRSTIKIY